MTDEADNLMARAKEAGLVISRAEAETIAPVLKDLAREARERAGDWSYAPSTQRDTREGAGR